MAVHGETIRISVKKYSGPNRRCPLERRNGPGDRRGSASNTWEGPERRLGESERRLGLQDRRASYERRNGITERRNTDALGLKLVQGRMPSGRAIVLSLHAEGESVEIRGADGNAEVEVTFTSSGAVVNLHGDRFRVAGPDGRAWSADNSSAACNDVKTIGRPPLD